MSKAQAQAIANALGGGIAPTPQNTPLQATPGGLSRPHIPTTIGEDEDENDEDIPTISSNQMRDDIRGQLAGNPLLAQMVQGKLNSLIGKSSGYLESLSPVVRQRVEGLKGLQLEHTKLEAEFQKEILELEKRFAEKYRPIYDRRREIIEGKIQPTEEEIKAGFKVDANEDEEDEEEAPEIITGAEAEQGEKGIPNFWLTALSNHTGISELITERDEEALKYLADIRVEYLESGKPGFKLLFEFSEGAKEFFEDKVLTKTYFYQEEVGSLGDFVYDHAEGTDVKWKTGKDLTVRVETKKQRNKNTNQTRTVKKVVPTDSFFTFFKPPVPPTEEDEESALEEDIDEKLELDYQIGEDIKDRIVPHAIDYFTGKALQQDMEDGDFDSEEFDDEDEDDLDDEEDDDEDEVPAGRAIKGARKAAQPPTSGVTPGSAQDPQECKNQ